MTDKEKVAQLESQLAEVRALAQAAVTGGKQDAAAMARKQETAAKRAELKARAKKEGSSEGEVAVYFIPETAPKFYRRGEVVKPGNVVRLPVSEDPSVTWLPFEDEKPKASPSAPKHTTRPADRDVA